MIIEGNFVRTRAVLECGRCGLSFEHRPNVKGRPRVNCYDCSPVRGIPAQRGPADYNMLVAVSDQRAAIEYAKAVLRTGRPRAEALAALSSV